MTQTIIDPDKENYNYRKMLGCHGSRSHTYDELHIILHDCLRFLFQNPTETIVIMVKSEDCYDSYYPVFPTFSDSFEWYEAEAAYYIFSSSKEIIFPKTSDGNLFNIVMKEARGKILLTTRDKNPGEPGYIENAQQIEWKNDATWTEMIKAPLRSASVEARISDEYGDYSTTLYAQSKENAFKKNEIHIPLADIYNTDLLILELSGSYCEAPKIVADALNPWFLKDSKWFWENFRLGWFLMDYVVDNNDVRGIVDKCIYNSTKRPRGLCPIAVDKDLFCSWKGSTTIDLSGCQGKDVKITSGNSKMNNQVTFNGFKLTYKDSMQLHDVKDQVYYTITEPSTGLSGRGTVTVTIGPQISDYRRIDIIRGANDDHYKDPVDCVLGQPVRIYMPTPEESSEIVDMNRNPGLYDRNLFELASGPEDNPIILIPKKVSKNKTCITLMNREGDHVANIYCTIREFKPKY